MPTKQKVKAKPRRTPVVYMLASVIIGAALCVFIFFGARGTNASIAPNVEQFSVASVAAQRWEQVEIAADGSVVALLDQHGGETRVYIGQSYGSSNNIIDDGWLVIDELGQSTAFTLHPDGSDFIIVEDTQTARRYDTQTGAMLATWAGWSSVRYSPDGTRLAVVEVGYGIRIYDVAVTTVIAQIPLDVEQTVRPMAFSTNNSLAYAIGTTAYVYDLTTGTTQAFNLPGAENMRDLAYHPNGDWLALVGNRDMQVVNTVTNERVYYPFNDYQLQRVAFSPDGDWLVMAGGSANLAEDYMIALRWTLTDTIAPDPAAYQQALLNGHEHIVRDVAFRPDGKLVSVAWDSTIRLWDVATEQFLIVATIGY